MLARIGKSLPFLIALGFVGVLLLGIGGTVMSLMQPVEETAEQLFHEEPKRLDLPSDGPFGRFDRQQLQRGFQVFKEVCSACHALNLVSFRELEGLGYNEAEVKAIAQQWAIQQPAINPRTGEASTRANLPSDRFPAPYPNEIAARAANNNALPPDLSLITKAREGGPAYVYSLLTGYQQPSRDLRARFPHFETQQGLHYNPYFATLNVAMPPPLTTEGQVSYVDGTRPTVDRMARDVSAFLVWTAEPTLERRHAVGVATVGFLFLSLLLAIGAYRSVWRGVKH